MATDSVTVSPTFNGDSVSLTAGMIVRLKPGANNNVVRAQADSAPHVQGVNGIVVSGSSAPGGVLTVICTGRESVQLEAGLTLVVGDTVYVSPNVAGKGTNVAPSVLLPIGAIADISNYSRLGTVEVDVVCGSSGVGGGGAFPGYGTPGSIGPNEPTTGTSPLVLRADAQPGQKIEARWGIGAVRWYALDPVNGDDTRPGFSDVNEADAGTKAVKTSAALAAIFPPVGSGRKVSISIANGGVNTAATLAGSIDFLIFGISGYVGYTLKATGTQPNAGAVAFAGDANTDIYNGGITASGVNVAGYNPTGGATTTAVPCQLAGGGAAALPAEPAAPLGWRIRFDIATATVALRGICKQVTQVQSAQVNVNTALPAVPATNDVFYLEQAGVNVTATNILFSCGPQMGNSPAIAGFKFSGQLAVYGSPSPPTLAFCGVGSLIFAQGATLNAQRFYTDTAAGVPRASGGGLRNEGAFNQNGWGNNTQLTGFVQAGNSRVSIESPTGLSTLVGSYFFGGLLVWGGALVTDGDTPQIGSNNVAAPMRIVAPASDPIKTSGLLLKGTRTNIDGIVITGMGAHPAVALMGKCDIVFGAAPGPIGVSGSTGNTDVGMDLTTARGCTIVIGPTVPTVTGTVGDVRLADGSVISWATAVAGVIDAAGNRIFSSTTAPFTTTVAPASVAVALGSVGSAGITAATPDKWLTVVIGNTKYAIPLWPTT